jgi:hypothetical protein
LALNHQLTAGSVGLVGFQPDEDNGSLPASLSFISVDPLPKGMVIKMVCGDQFFGQLMRGGPHLTFTATKYIVSGSIITWRSDGSTDFPTKLSIPGTVRGEDGKLEQLGFFTHHRPFPKVERYQLYIYAGKEERPIFLFGLITQIGMQFPKALKKGKSVILMKRLNLGDSLSPTNFVFCPYLQCHKGSCHCTKFNFHGDKIKMLGTLTFAKNWYGQGRGKAFPDIGSGWMRDKYKFKCINCK